MDAEIEKSKEHASLIHALMVPVDCHRWIHKTLRALSEPGDAVRSVNL